MRRLNETVMLLYNCPCIAMWVPFNEAGVSLTRIRRSTPSAHWTARAPSTTQAAGTTRRAGTSKPPRSTINRIDSLPMPTGARWYSASLAAITSAEHSFSQRVWIQTLPYSGQR